LAAATARKSNPLFLLDFVAEYDALAPIGVDIIVPTLSVRFKNGLGRFSSSAKSYSDDGSFLDTGGAVRRASDPKFELLVDGRRWGWGSGLGWGTCDEGSTFIANPVGSEAEVGNVTERLRVDDRMEGLRIRVGGKAGWVEVAFVKVDETGRSETSSFSFSLSFVLSLSLLELGLGGGLRFMSSSH